jgi:hypothetical protein
VATTTAVCSLSADQRARAVLNCHHEVFAEFCIFEKFLGRKFLLDLKKTLVSLNTVRTPEPSCRSHLPILRYECATIEEKYSHGNNSDHHRCRELGGKWYSPRATALRRLLIDSKAHLSTGWQKDTSPLALFLGRRPCYRSLSELGE